MNAPTTRSRKESGIALLTTVLLLLLMSSMLVGFVVLINSSQKLNGANNDYGRSFYAAEAGMEKMTADLGNLFDTNYSPSGSQIQALQTNPPSLSGIVYQKGDGTSGYSINYPGYPGNPTATNATVKSGPFQGMTALATPYTLTVTARTSTGAEVKLQRTTQTVGIPMFQFGIFSDTDLSFFPGPPFNFGGRTHTNGNLFLATQTGPLSLSDRVTAVKNVIRTNLSNGFPNAGTYTGTVNITTSPGTSSYRALALNEGSLTGTLGSSANPNWNSISLGATNYAGNLRNGATGATALNLGIVILGNGTTQPVDLIRRPVVNEDPGITNLRYFAQASLKILLSDDPSDIMQLPCIDTSTQPFDLSSMAMPVANWTGNAATLRTLMVTNNTAGKITPPVPLAASGAVQGATTYNSTNGYWLPTPTGTAYSTGSGLPLIKGYIKIEVQTAYGSPCGTWRDVTLEVLSYGYAGKNINPQGNGLSTSQYGTAEPLLGLPTTALGPPTGASACADVHPNAIIRLERVRDNPSNYATGTLAGRCGVTSSATPSAQNAPGAYISSTTIRAGVPADYWPNSLFDPREGQVRDVTPSTSTGVGTIKYSQMVTLAGVMQYIELDAKNLASYLGGAGVYASASGHSSYDSTSAPNDFAVYISDRRNNYTASSLTNPWPPLSPSTHETGEYGWNDFVNLNNSNGCPNGTQDTGEDLDGLGSTGFYTYGSDPTHAMTQYGFYSAGTPGNLYGTTISNALAANATCSSATPSWKIWQLSEVIHANEARQNPNPLFRKAVKIVNGNLLTALGTCPGSVPCGLAIATENPVYVFGDFNANSAGGGFNNPNVAASINADAVTLLSNNYNDVNSFAFPFQNQSSNIVATTTYYRAAVMAGKGISFPQPSGTNQDFGTDGGVHNFLRFNENWGGQTLNYVGSIISMYTNRQATGTYKCCTTVYSAPTRGYNFDVEFLTPALLPPRTPVFRDVNTTGFTQLLLPNQQ